MKQKAFALVLLFTLWLVSAVPAPLQSSTNIPEGLTAAEWHAIQSLVPGSYIKPSNTGANDRFGWAVALNGDTMVVGAYLEDSNATGIDGDQTNNLAPDSGAAYVFIRTDGVWSQQAYLKASNTDAGDEFGHAVALSGDTIVIGALMEDSNATGIDGDQTNNSASQSGAAYVFTRDGTTWTQQAYLKASNTDAGDNFGWSVAVDGDTIVVGAYWESSNATGVNGNQTNNSAPQAGAAYIFARNEATWTQQAYLKASHTDIEDYFGASVAIWGDTIVVGARLEDSNATGVDGNSNNNSASNSGAAYVFVRHEGEWSHQAYLKASNTGIGDRFGRSLAIWDDTIVVGAYREDSNATGIDGDQSNNAALDAGAAYVFTRTDGLWTQQAYLKASNTFAGDEFAINLDISGDTIVVGARYEDSNATGINGNQEDNSAVDAGAAYIFTRTGGIWSQQAYLKASNTQAGDNFGWNVAIADGVVVIGAFSEDSNATGVNNDQSNNAAANSGAVYTFEPAIYPLHIILAGTGTGQVGSIPEGISCGVTCTTYLTAGTVVSLTATADTGSSFVDWSGDLISITNPITFSMDMTRTITATFDLNQYELNVTTVGNGTAAPNSGTYDYGTVVTLTATADLGSTFTDWSGDVLSTTNPVTLTMDSDKFITATFSLNQYELNVATVGNGTAAPNSGTYDYGTVVTLTATAATGSTFTDWSGDVISTTNPVTLTMNSDKFITATFTLNQYELNVATVGNGTAAPNSGTYDYGTVVTLTATADLGSTFIDWSGDVVSTTNPITVTMASDKFITATFSLNQYELNVVTVGNGTAVPNSGTYDYGTVVTVTATADTGSTFLDWSGDVVTTTNPITVTMDSDKFITATFETTNITYTLYLPVVMRPSLAIQLGSAYLSEPIAEQGATFYTNTVTIPAQLPAGGQYYLSSSSSMLAPVVVDDELIIEVNGQPIFTQEFGQPPTGLVLPLEPSVISQMAGQTITIYYRDVYGNQQGATAVWLIWMP